MPIQVTQRGIVEIVGEHDTGKTIAMLQAVYPYRKTVFVDDDVKGDATVKQLEEMEGKKRTEIFAEYIDLRLWRAKLPSTPTSTQLLEQIIDPVIEHISQKKYEVIIWDTWRIVYQAARGHVDRNQNLYGRIVKFQGSSAIIQGLVSKVARMIEQTYLSKLRDSCELLLISHHVKDWYANNVVVGVIPESSSTFDEQCSMRIWLRRNTQSKVPVMLFLKRPNAPKIVKGKPRFVNIVPPKITPTAKDQSIWDAIARYELDPVESRELRPDERPTKDEMSMISGTLSEDQKLFMMDVIKYQEKEKQTISKIANASSMDTDEPDSGIQLLTMSMSEHGLDGEQVSSIIDVPYEDIISMSLEEVLNGWEKVQKHVSSKSSNK